MQMQEGTNRCQNQRSRGQFEARQWFAGILPELKGVSSISIIDTIINVLGKRINYF
jgi:hypothetical protein